MNDCNSDIEVKRDRTKELQFTARFKIHDGKLDDFRTLAAECLRMVQEKDKGTIQYEWFFNKDQTECVVLERYQDSDAVLQHSTNLHEPLGALSSVSDLSGEVYGSPSPELLKAAEGMDIVIYTYFQGLK